MQLRINITARCVFFAFIIYTKRKKVVIQYMFRGAKWGRYGHMAFRNTCSQVASKVGINYCLLQGGLKRADTILAM